MEVKTRDGWERVSVNARDIYEALRVMTECFERIKIGNVIW